MTTLAVPQNLPAPLRLLDVYAPDGVINEEDLPRIDALATISAGLKVQNGGKEFPQASRDGTIHVHDPNNLALGLREVLSETGGKSLTIAFPYDNPADFIQQRFVEYSASSLVCYGDETSMTYVDAQGHHEFAAGTPEFAQLLQRPGLKVSTSVYFHLAQWTENGPLVIFPDGLGLYRLRFTSRNSLRSLKASIEYILRFTSGRIAGLPLELSIGYRDVSGPDGKRRKVAVWQCRMRPPQNVRLTSDSFRFLAQKSLEQGAQLMLPAPARETMQMAALEAPAIDLDETAIETLEKGGLCDAAHWRTVYFAAFEDTPLVEQPGRREFLLWHTDKQTGSLSKFLAGASEDEARAMIEAGRLYLKSLVADSQHEQLAQYNDLAETANTFGVTYRGKPFPLLGANAHPDVIAKGMEAVERALRENGLDTGGSAETPPASPLTEAVRAKHQASVGTKNGRRALPEIEVSSEAELEIASEPMEPGVEAGATEPYPDSVDMVTQLIELAKEVGFVDAKGVPDEDAMCAAIFDALDEAGQGYEVNSLYDVKPEHLHIARDAIRGAMEMQA